MKRPTQKPLLVVLTSLLTLFAGCASHRSGAVYQLSEINSQYFLLSPYAADSHADRQTLHIPRAPNSGTCSIKGAWFSFYPAADDKSWIVESPSAAAWERGSGTVDIKEEWQKFETALYGSPQGPCSLSLKEYLSVKQRIAESLSTPAEDSLFYRYAYGAGGFVDLAPAMQLRIERVFLGAGGNYRGTIITTYGVSADAQNEAKLNLLGIDNRPLANPELPDMSLAERFAAASRLRLFLQDLVVSGNDKTPAILIGTSSDGDLNTVTQEIESNPKITCADLRRPQVTCAFFNGSVTVSPMIQVALNGVRTYVPIGSKLLFVLPHVNALQRDALLKKVRLQRLFQGKLTAVEFARTEDVISQLLLVGGDRLSWPRNVAAGK
jgi:hypothetical protein